MKSNRSYPTVTLTKKGQRFIEGGHVWVYAEEITAADPAIENGALVDVLTDKGRYLGTGFYSEHSKIRVRLLSRNANDKFDEAFWARRIRYALDYRRTVYGDDVSACRLIFGEADSFPGLTVDRFSDLLVTQTLSFGMDKRLNVILPLLAEELKRDGMPIEGIYERNDVAIRSLEGLEQNKGWFDGFRGASTLTRIVENGVHYHVDVENGQKTGFFLDQRLNRRALAAIAKDKTVLDCFTHTGSFAFNAVMGGAKRVTAVDISEEALSTARKNAALNDFSGKGVLDFLCADVFDLLPALEKEGKSPYDLIILDPPAFTKSRKTVANAERGYKEINYRAMKLLPRGGYLATCSCSHFMENSLFVKMLHAAAADAGVTLRQIEARQQAPDHPILMNVPETDYLKFYLFQVV